MNSNPSKTLVFRLSSLGDIVLATTALTARSLHTSAQVDWVVSREFSGLFDGHPGIRKLWVFDRKKGFSGWIALCRQLYTEDYSEVLDLHASLRTRLAKIIFRFFSLIGRGPFPVWRQISKQRFRLYGFFIFKKLWPVAWRPTSLRERFALIAGGTGKEAPDFKWCLVKNSGVSVPELPYLCVMPGSAWVGKRWPVRKFFETIRSLPVFPVILGSKTDRESVLLVKLLEQAGLAHISGIGTWNLSQVAQVLGHSSGYFGNDTGLAHLAEAVGVPAFIVFGPTVPEMGFGPWRRSSRSIGADLWCRPCGKDGSYCFRSANRYQCLELLEPKTVVQLLDGLIS